MLNVRRTKRFDKDIHLAQKRQKKIHRLEHIVELLAYEQALPASCRPHKLSGDYEGCWDCHVEADSLLIYAYKGEELWLLRYGTHSDLF